MVRVMIAGCLLGLVGGCAQPPANGNSNGNDNTPDPSVVVVDLGTTGMFGEGLPVGVEHAATFDISADVPAETADEIRIYFDPMDISIGTAFDAGTNGADGGTNGFEPVDALLLVLVSAADDPLPCGAPSQLQFFDVAISTAGTATVTPEFSVVDSNGFGLLSSGRFSMCLAASATRVVPLTIDALRIRYVLPGEVVATSCADIVALPEVSAAITTLGSNGIAFALPGGTDVPDLTGSYALTQTTTFDPDGDNTGDEVTGTVTLSDRTDATITRSGFDASIEQFVVGDATSIGFCTLDRTNDPTCDQTIARLESHIRDAQTGDMEGQFLAVAVRRHAATDTSCGTRGSFVAGDISLASTTPQLVQRRGKVALPASMLPDLLILPGGGRDGVVTDQNSGAAQRFNVDTPFAAQALTIPADLAPTGFSALGRSVDGDLVAVVTDLPDAALIYTSDDFALFRQNAESTFDYIGALVDFDVEGTRIFIPSTSTTFADRISVLRTDDGPAPDEVLRLNTPQGKVPVQVRVSPDGTQLAVLLENGAPLGEAGQLTFGTSTAGAFRTPIDLEQDAGGTVLASELLYSLDGSRVFVAGLGAVIAVSTTVPPTITRIDVSSGAGDNPVALALSGDGAVLAVAIDDATGQADFAVIDTGTLEVLNAQDLPGIGTGRAIDVAHFATQRIAVVANLESTVTAVQTESPFAAVEPILLTDVAGSLTLGRAESAGDLVAVTNTAEPAVYLLELAEP